MNLSVICIVVALAVLMFLAFNRVSILVATLVCSVLVAIANGLPVLETISTAYMGSFGSFVSSWLLVFAFSALFGKVMEESGAAKAFAQLICKGFSERYAVYGCILATGLLCYGGVSVFVIVFAVYPIFVECFKRANIPTRLLPGAIAFMPFTAASACFPGAPAINNIVPTQYLNTTLMAAPVVGTIAGLVMCAFAVVYLEREIKVARATNENFIPNAAMLAQIEKDAARGRIITPADQVLSVIPLVGLVILVNILHVTVWVAMVIVTVFVVIAYWKQINDKISVITSGLAGSFGAIMNTSAVVAFGSVVKATDGFQMIIDKITNIGGNPLISLGLSTTLISGVTGSGSGGVGTAMAVLSERYLGMGVNPEILHRVVSVASIGLDSLPHNSAVVTLLAVCGFTHKEGYKSIFMLTVVNSLIALAVTIAVGAILY